jgi:hypothetical protein
MRHERNTREKQMRVHLCGKNIILLTTLQNKIIGSVIYFMLIFFLLGHGSFIFIYTNNCEGSKPERTATSFFSRPLEMNLAVILSKVSKGDGKLFASLSLAVVPSLRPRGTNQNGPLL